MRRIIRWAVLGVFGLLVAPVIQEFAVRLAEQWGAFDNKNGALGVVMSLGAIITQQPWFWPVFMLWAGFTLGVWLDWILRRREQQAIGSPVDPIDRIALADEADALAGKISALLGEYQGRFQIAWWDEGRDEKMSRKKTTEIDAVFIERYGERYHKDVWRIIFLAQKCIEMDFGDVWRISHTMSPHEFHEVTRVLIKIAVALRQPQPDIPMFDRARRPKPQIQTDKVSGGEVQIDQLPQGTEPKAQP